LHSLHQDRFISQATVAEHADEFKEMVEEWYKSSGGADLPPELKELVAKLGVNLTATTTVTDPSTPSRQGKREKNTAITPTAGDGAVQDSLEGLRFVLSGTWPNLGGGSGLKVGKQRLKARIEQFGGRVTGDISGVTDVLVIGKSPGPKKMVEALEKEVKVFDIDILNHMIRGELSLDEIRSLKASGEDTLVHPLDHQVQHQSQTPMPTKQAKQGTAGPEGNHEVDHSNE
jgi:NAD-dependent DNA ligase